MSGEAVWDVAALRAGADAIVGGRHVRQVGSRRLSAQPSSMAEVALLVRLAHKEHVIVSPVGNAARLRDKGGDRPRLFIELCRMNHVLRLDETSLVVHAQAGLAAHALERILAPRGLTLGDFPPSSLTSTLGGLLAVRTPGKSSRRHGTIEDGVLGLSAVLADGRAVHTRVAPRRASGPDLARALTGTEGALCILTAVVLRVHRRPESRLLAAFALQSFGDALGAVRLALREEAAPTALRIYDRGEAKAHFDGQIPDDAGAVLVAATSGPTDLAACDRDLIASAVHALGGRALSDDLAIQWWRRRMGQDVYPGPALPSLQVSATPGALLSVYEAARRTGSARRCEVRAHASRFDFDGGVLFFSLAHAPDAGLEARETAVAAIEEACCAAGAVLVNSPNPLLDPYTSGMRDVLDPDRLFNPDVLEG